MTEWRIARLGEICEISAGGDRPQLVSDKETDICHVPIYSNGVDNNGLYGFTDREKIKGDSITITARGANVGTVFYRKTAYYPIIRLLSLQPNEELINSRYLYYLIKNKSFLSTGSAQPQITVPNISKFVIEYNSDVAVQRYIAEVLSRYDSLIENYQRQIKLLEEAAQRLYKEWFVDLRFPGHETTSIINNLPDGWQKRRVGELVLKSQRTKQIPANRYQTIGRIPIIDQSRNYIAGYTDDQESIVNVTEPYIVFGDHTRVLKYVPFPFAKGADGTQLIMSSDLNRMPQTLLYNSLINIDLSNYSYARHFKYLKEESIIVPSRNIAVAYNNIVAKYFQIIQNNRESIRHLTEARDRLLPKIMNGEIIKIFD